MLTNPSWPVLSFGLSVILLVVGFLYINWSHRKLYEIINIEVQYGIWYVLVRRNDHTVSGTSYTFRAAFKNARQKWERIYLDPDEKKAKRLRAKYIKN